MSDIETALEQALRAVNPPPMAVIRCDPATAADVVRRGKERFVRGDPRAWWLSPLHPGEVFEYPDADGADHLLEHVPAGQPRCWFIPETEEDLPPVYDVEPKWIPALLRECFLFEYYVLGREFDWMVVENDHNQVVVTRLPAKSDPNGAA